jgi:hypothetical protein
MADAADVVKRILKPEGSIARRQTSEVLDGLPLPIGLWE